MGIRGKKRTTKETTEIFDDQLLNKYAKERIFTYGSYVVEERALPDFRDGLKPVQRRILWSMHKNGFASKGPFKKSAKTVGDCIFWLHPHGDMALYGAMVNITNAVDNKNNVIKRKIPMGLIAGGGNWGDFCSPAAHYRYSECRLSPFSEQALLVKDYINVTDMVPNYLNDNEEPVILPALLPLLLLNGSHGIAVGVMSRIPPFHPKGLIKLIKQNLKGKKVVASDCVDNLEFNYSYGAVPIETPANMKSYFKTGIGSVKFKLDYTFEVPKRQIVITGLTPNFNIETFIEKMQGLPEIAYAGDQGGGAGGKEPIRIVVRLKADIPQKDVQIKFKSLEKYLTQSVGFRTNVTIRELNTKEEVPETKASFKKTTIPDIINDWCTWRLELETKMLKFKMNKLNEKIAYLELMRYAISKLDIIFRILKSKSKNLNEDLAKALKIKLEEAKLILDRQVRALSNMTDQELVVDITELQKQVKEIKVWLKKPEDKIINEIDNISLVS